MKPTKQNTPPPPPVQRMPPPRIDVRRTATLRRVDSLFKTMASDFLLREQFVTEPSQVVAEYIGNDRLAPEQADVSDQLVYAVMSSPPLLAWLRDYALKHGRKDSSREQLIQDVLAGAAATRSHHVLIALARASIARQDVLTGDVAVLPALLDLIVHGGRGIFAQTEMSTGHTTGTEMSTGHIFATEMSTGHTTGTEMSTGHIFATEMSTGHTTGTEMSTGHIFATEMSTGHSTGTEMSTGHTTGTEKSTGHYLGTDMFRPGYQRIALAALADYALLLRNGGALDRLFGR